MNTASLNNLWSYLKGLSLTKSNRRWLAERLIEQSADDDVMSREKKFFALAGSWHDTDDSIVEAILSSRESDYTREIAQL